MTWGSKREKIATSLAHEHGLTHVQPHHEVYATPDRRSMVVVGVGGPTGFTKTKAGWKVHEYDTVAGRPVRRPAKEAMPYDEYLQSTRQSNFRDRRS